MTFRHTNRPGFLLGFIDFFTAGIFFLLYMPLGGLQDEIEFILGHKVMPYWKAYLLGIPNGFIYTLVWMAQIAEELKGKAVELGIEGPYTSWRHMFGWNVFGLILMGPAVATHRFFGTLNAVEKKLNKRSGPVPGRKDNHTGTRKQVQDKAGNMDHIQINELSYRKPVIKWLLGRYGKDEALRIWKKTRRAYNSYLLDLPDYGGKKNGHSNAIYGGLLIFALYPSLPDHPPIAELQSFVQNLFMEPFTKLGKVFDLNRNGNMWLIDKVFQKVGERDRKDAERYPAGFVNVNEPYDREHHAALYHFTQCPNAEFAKKHDLLHVLPLLCNCDFFGIEELHGKLIRCGTCGNSEMCDYLVVGDQNPIAEEYETVTDERGFLVSRRKSI